MSDTPKQTPAALVEWSAAVSAEYEAAGFKVTLHCGFPLVVPAPTQAETVRLLKFQPTRAVDVQIYAEGMLVLPAGAAAILREKQTEVKP